MSRWWGIVGAAWVIGLFGCSERSGGVHGGKTEVSDAPAQRRPPTANVVLRPYDLTQDAFRYRGNIVQLDLKTLPWFNQGQFWQWIPYPNRALRLNKMLTRGEVLYDVVARMTPGQSYESVGQLVVEIESRAEPPEPSSNVLRP